MTTYWLVLILLSGTPLHIGNYGSMTSCQTAAKQATVYNPGRTNLIVHNYICVQANESNTQPPSSSTKQ